MSLRVCICGGGSLGITCAAFISSKGVIVDLLTGHPEKWNNDIRVTDINGRIYNGKIDKISNTAEGLIPRADIVLLCLPGYLIEKTLHEIKPYLKEDTFVGSIVSSTGFFFFAHRILGENIPLFGFQRVPFIARCIEYGSVGSLLGYKPELKIAVENIDPQKMRQIIEQLFYSPVKILNNFYEASLTNSNPLLHTSRLYSMWNKYDGEISSSCSLFYADWTDEASHILINMDREFMSLTAKLGISENVIPSILDYYESKDEQSLTRKIRSIPAFKNISSPMITNGEGWIPDFHSRYFTEDFPFGLKIIKELGEQHNISMPVIDSVLDWGLSKIK